MLNTKIDWCDHTINWWWGCSKVSPACQHCYAESLDERFHPANWHDGKPNTTGSFGLHWGKNAPRLIKVDSALRNLAKVRRRAARTGERPRVFINSMSDFFEDRRDLDEARLAALDAMRQAPEVDFLLLTKRPEEIRALLEQAARYAQGGDDDLPIGEGEENPALHEWLLAWLGGNPPRNIWLGTTVENQEWADKRIPELLKVPAAVRFLSVEPMLGPVSLLHWMPPCECPEGFYQPGCSLHGQEERIDWVITGGESGPHARPMHPDWARSLRDQCAAAGVPFFFKQNGEWLPIDQPWEQESPAELAKNERWMNRAGGHGFHGEQVWRMRRVGKKAAGRLLDGMEHNALPAPPKEEPHAD